MAHILVLGHKSGSEAVLTASLAAWSKHFADCEIIVIGDKCELPKGVKHIPYTGDINGMITAATEKVEADKFVFAYCTYPLTKVTLSDIDKPYCNSDEDFYTRLPRLYEKSLLKGIKVEARQSIEHAYFAAKYKGKKLLVLKDLADKIRLKVFDLAPDTYRTKHLLKHKKFLVTNSAGQKAIDSFRA